MKKEGFTPLEINNIITTNSVIEKRVLNTSGCSFQRRRSRLWRDLSLTGFSLIELLVVISIIAILATLILPGLTRAKVEAKVATAKAEISSFAQALSMYDADFGAYPPEIEGNSSKTLVDTLKGDPKSTPPKKPYFQFKKDRIAAGGEYQSPLYKPYYYRENASAKTKTDDMKKPFEYDIWTEDSKKKADGINNWD